MSKFSLALDSSQIVAYMTCPQLWKYQYKDNLEPLERKHAAFSKGTLVHSVLESYYKNIDSGVPTATKCGLDVVDKYRLDYLKDPKCELTKDDLDLIAARFILYTAKYQNDLVPVVHNGKKVVELGFSYPLVDNDLFLFVLEGRIDLITQSERHNCVVDHKSQGRYSKYNARRVQFLNYALGMNVNHMMVNIFPLQAKFDDKNMFRQLFYYSPETMRQWKTKLTQIFFRIANSIMLSQVERNESACEGKYGYPCDFCQLCDEHSEQVYNNLIKFKYKKREPWSPWEETE